MKGLLTTHKGMEDIAALEVNELIGKPDSMDQMTKKLLEKPDNEDLRVNKYGPLGRDLARKKKLPVRYEPGVEVSRHQQSGGCQNVHAAATLTSWRPLEIVNRIMSLFYQRSFVPI